MRLLINPTMNLPVLAVGVSRPSPISVLRCFVNVPYGSSSSTKEEENPRSIQSDLSLSISTHTHTRADKAIYLTYVMQSHQRRENLFHEIIDLVCLVDFPNASIQIDENDNSMV